MQTGFNISYKKVESRGAETLFVQINEDHYSQEFTRMLYRCSTL